MVTYRHRKRLALALLAALLGLATPAASHAEDPQAASGDPQLPVAGRLAAVVDLTSPDPTLQRAIQAGAPRPWHGSTGGVDAYTQAKTTPIELTGWYARGGLPMSFELVHNSQPFESISDPSVGPGWMHSAGAYIKVWSHWGVQRAAFVHLHQVHLFERVGGGWQPLDGYRHQLVAVGSGFHVILKSLTRLEFEPTAAAGRFRLKRTVDTNGNAITNDYDAAGRWTRTTDPSGRVFVPHYNASGKLVNLSYGIGTFAKQCLVAFDAAGRVQRVTWPTFTGDSGPQSCVVQIAYGAGNAITSLTDAAGSVWQYGYDTAQPGRLAWEQWPGNGAAQRQTYAVVDAHRRRIVDPRGVALELEFAVDAAGHARLVKATDAEGNATLLDFGDADYSWAPSSIVTPGGDAYRYDFDARGNAIDTIDPAGNRWDYSFDLHNRCTQIIEPPVTDAWGAIEPAGNRWDYGYDANHNLIWTRQYRSATEFVQTSYARDAYGQVVAATDANGQITTYEHDVYGNTTRRTTPLGRSRRWLFENAVASVGFTRPNALIDGRGARTNLTYNERGWLKLIDYPAGTADESFDWDRRGLMLRASGADGTTTYAYSPQGWKTDELRSGWSLHRDYLPNGLVSALIESGSAGVRTIAKGYDAVNRLVSVDDGGLTTTFAFDADGRVTDQFNANGSRAAYTYVAGRPATIAHFSASGVEFLRFERSYQADGVLSQVVERSAFSPVPAVVRYGYDFANLLIREERNDPYVVSFNDVYTRDAAGRIARRNSSLSGITDYPRDADGLTLALLGPGWSTMTYWDENLCLTQKTTVDAATGTIDEEFLLSYDAAQRLSAIWTNSAAGSWESHRYAYDAYGRRTQRVAIDPSGGQFASSEFYDGGMLLSEARPDGVAALSTFANGKLCLWRTEPPMGAALKAPATDGAPRGAALGSLRGASDTAGGAEPFGVIRNALGEVVWSHGECIPVGLGADGGWRDQGDAGFVVAGAGWYDPALASAISPAGCFAQDKPPWAPPGYKPGDPPPGVPPPGQPLPLRGSVQEDRQTGALLRHLGDLYARLNYALSANPGNENPPDAQWLADRIRETEQQLRDRGYEPTDADRRRGYLR